MNWRGLERLPFLVAIIICLGLAWRIYDSSPDPGDGRTGALALTLIAAVLTGGLLVDWAQRDRRRDHGDDPPPPPSKKSKGK